MCTCVYPHMQKRETVEREKQQAKLYMHARKSGGGGGNRKETEKNCFYQNNCTIKEVV